MPANVAGLVAYVLGFITGIAMLVIEPYKRDKFVRFHAFQSIFLSAAYLVLMFVWSALTGLLLTLGGGVLWEPAWLLWWALRIGFFALWLFLMYRAYSNDMFQLPIIGGMARKHIGAV